MAFDDFEDETINRWTAASTAGGSMVASTSANKFGSWGGRMTTDGAGDDAFILYTNSEMSGDPINLHTWIRTSDVSVTDSIVYELRSASETIAAFTITGSKFQVLFLAPANFVTLQDGGSQDIIAQNDTWYRLRIVYNDAADTLSYYLYDTNNNELSKIEDGEPRASATISFIRLQSRDNKVTPFTVDWDNTSYTDTA